jgi:hypothetical protein
MAISPLFCLCLVHLFNFSANAFVVPSYTSKSKDLLLLEATDTQNQQTAEQTSNLEPSSLRGLNNCESGTRARQFLQNALKDRSALYGSVTIPIGASSKGISDGDLAIQTRLVNKKYNIMQLIELSGDRDSDRASLAILCLTVASSVSALVVNQNLPGPEIIRFLFVWLLSFAPLAFVGYGIADIDKLQATLVSIQRTVFPAYRQRMLQHEAGHYLIGHLVGLPIRKYTANAVKNAVEFYPLSDKDKGRSYASLLGFDKLREGFAEEEPITVSEAPFFSKEGRGGLLLDTQSVFRDSKNYTNNEFSKVPSQNEPSNAWPYRGFDEATLDQLTVVSVAGVCAEILAFGNAEGGVADLSQLRQLFLSSDKEMTERDVDNRIRFALGYTMSQLRRHLGALDALAAAMGRDASIEECVLAIETCDNVSGQDVLGDYERKRREAFRTQSVNWVERIFLGGDRNVDTDEKGLVEGKGGGYRKEKFRLTGDDPLYGAIAVSVSFIVWASSGGLSLH